MKTIIVFGGTGQTGAEVVKAGAAKGYKVRAFDLRPGSLPKYENVSYIEGSVLDARAVQKALYGCDAVVSELGVRLGSTSQLVSEGNKVILAAMQKIGVKRFITQSAYGALESWATLPLYLKLAAKTPLLKPMYADKDQMEKLVRGSKLDWTIVRPVRLTSKPASGKLRAGTVIALGFNPHSARADVARFILGELEANNFVHQAVTLTY